MHLGGAVRIFEGRWRRSRALAPCDDCANEADCEVRRTMLEVKTAILNVIDRTSLQDMIERVREPIEL